MADLTNQPTVNDLNEGEQRFVDALPIQETLTNPDGFIDLLMRPVKLSQEQIEDILSAIPIVMSATNVSSETARNSMLRALAAQLGDIELTPLGIPEMKEQIQTKFHRSLIEPGTVVGIRAAEALGGPITQMALKTFHFSGSSKNISAGVDAIRELLNVTKERKRENMTIRFKDQHLDHDQIIERQADIVGLMVSEILDDHTVDLVDALERYWWHDVFSVVTGRSVPMSRWVLRLTFDVNVLFAYKVEMEQLAASIEAGSPTGVVCVYSPTSEGIIDIYPDEALIIESLKEYNLPLQDTGAMIFLTQIVQPNLDKIQVKGVPGIRKLYPVAIPVWSIVADEIRAFSDEQADAVAQQGDVEMANNMRRAWFLVYNKLKMRTTGMGVEKLKALCTTVGMAIHTEGPDYLTVVMPAVPELVRESAPGRNVTKPGIYVQVLVEADTKDENRYEEEQRRLGNRLFRRPPTALQRAARFMYADTDGTNLRTVLGRDDVDSEHTSSSNAYEIFLCLGIEACRNFLVSELLNIITMEGDYINARHVVTLVEFMCNRGEPLAITFSGVSRQPIGALAKASFQRPMETFAQAGGFGRREEIKSTSTSIYVGKRTELGTGFFDMQADDEAIAQFQQQLNQNDPNQRMELDPERFGRQIDELEDLTFGSGMMDFNDEADLAGAGLDMMFMGTMTTGATVPTIGATTVIQNQPLPTDPTIIELKAQPIIPQQLAGIVNQLVGVPGVVQQQTQPQQPVVVPLATPTRTPVVTAPLPVPVVTNTGLPSLQPTGLPTLGGFTQQGFLRPRGEQNIQLVNTNQFLQ